MRPATNEGETETMTIQAQAIQDARANCERAITQAHFDINRAQAEIFEATTDRGCEIWFGELKRAQVELREQVALRDRLDARVSR
jgi:hypothetical protein